MAYGEKNDLTNCVSCGDVDMFLSEATGNTCALCKASVRIAKLRKALEKHGQHSRDCTMGWVKPDKDGEYPCICGYREALAG